MPILKSHLYSYIVSWNIKGTMMERFYFKGFNCKCETHFSPPAKNYNLTLIHFWESIRKENCEFVQGQGDREKRIFALGFAGSKKKESRIFSNLHLFFINGFRYGDLKYCSIMHLIILEMFFDSWSMGYFIRIKSIVFPTFGIRAVFKNQYILD